MGTNRERNQEQSVVELSAREKQVDTKPGRYVLDVKYRLISALCLCDNDHVLEYTNRNCVVN